MTQIDESGPNPPRSDVPWGSVTVEDNIDAWEIIVTVRTEDSEAGVRITPDDLFPLRAAVRQAIRSYEDSTLEACPFCGGGNPNFYPLEPKGVKVVCSDCGASTGWCGDISAAVLAWDRRHRHE